MVGVSYGNRTRVPTLKASCPGPLDERDGVDLAESTGIEPVRRFRTGHGLASRPLAARAALHEWWSEVGTIHRPAPYEGAALPLSYRTACGGSLARAETAGGHARDRTANPRFWRPVLCRLSYVPKNDGGCGWIRTTVSRERSWFTARRIQPLCHTPADWRLLHDSNVRPPAS
jgi:hypothetical protein